MSFLRSNGPFAIIHDYLYSNSVLVRTDDNPLTYVLSTAKLDATGHRWLASLSVYDIRMQYRSGKENVDADTLSRLPSCSDCRNPSDTIKALLQVQSDGQNQVPAIECLSLGQQVLSDNPTDEVGIGTSFSTIDWKHEQIQDPTLARVRQLLEVGHPLTERQKSLETPTVRSFFKEWKNLFFKDSILYRKSTSNVYPVPQIVHPSHLLEVVFGGFHDHAGHQGCSRTISLVRTRFFWPQLEQFVEHRIRTCSRCIRRKTLD